MIKLKKKSIIFFNTHRIRLIKFNHNTNVFQKEKLAIFMVCIFYYLLMFCLCDYYLKITIPARFCALLPELLF